MVGESMGDLISVIVPVYNVEEYLEDCVDSILQQSYQELEIILVDDGSPDNCGRICDAYQKKDDRVKVLHKENGGLSDARNAGIGLAAGEWVVFVDSDDVLDVHFVEALFMLVQKYQADIAVCGLKKFTGVFSGRQEYMSDDGNIGTPAAVLDRTEALTHLLYQALPMETSTPGKLYRRTLFDGILFPLGMYYEDLATIYRVLMKSERIVTVQAALYGYRIRQTSIMHEHASPKMLSCIPVSRQMYEEISAAYPDLSDAAASRAFSVNRCIYLQLLHRQKKERSAVWQEMKKYRGIVLTDKNARKRERVMALLSYMGPEIMHLCSGLYKRQQDMNL